MRFALICLLSNVPKALLAPPGADVQSKCRERCAIRALSMRCIKTAQARVTVPIPRKILPGWLDRSRISSIDTDKKGAMHTPMAVRARSFIHHSLRLRRSWPRPGRSEAKGL